MYIFLKFCSIISIIIAALKIALMGNLSSGTFLFILLAGILILIGNRKVYVFSAAITALILFVKVYGGNYTGQLALLQSILTLSFICLGLFIMCSGLFGDNNRPHSNK